MASTKIETSPGAVFRHPYGNVATSPRIGWASTPIRRNTWEKATEPNVPGRQTTRWSSRTAGAQASAMRAAPKAGTETSTTFASAKASWMSHVTSLQAGGATPAHARELDLPRVPHRREQVPELGQLEEIHSMAGQREIRGQREGPVSSSENSDAIRHTHDDLPLLQLDDTHVPRPNRPTVDRSSRATASPDRRGGPTLPTNTSSFSTD